VPASRPVHTVGLLAGCAGAALAVIGLGIVGAYLERAPIGVRLAADYLRRRGVEARITIDRLDTGGASGTLSLGPRARPDLTVDRIEVEFEPIPLLRHGLVAPRLRAIRLVRPRLRATLHQGRLSFGHLQGLIDDAAKRPGFGPGPDVRVDAGRLLLATDAGEVAIDGDLVFKRGELDRADLELGPTDLNGRAWRARGLNGRLALRFPTPTTLTAAFRASARGLSAATGSGEGLSLEGVADLAHSGGSPTTLAGPLHGRATLAVAGLHGESVRAGPGMATLTVTGEGQGPISRPILSGRAQVDLGISAGRGAGLDVVGLTARLMAQSALIERRGQGWTAAGRVRGWTAAETMNLCLGHRRVRLDGTQLTAAGGAGWTGSATAALRGSFSTTSHLSASDAGALAAAVPASLPTLRGVVGDALRSTRVNAPALSVALSSHEMAVRLERPLSLSGGGATLTLVGRPGTPSVAVVADGASGGFDLQLAGAGLPDVGVTLPRYRVRHDGGSLGLDGRLGLRIAGDAPPLVGARAVLDAEVSLRSGWLRVEATGCAPVSIARVGSAAKPVIDALTLQLCPAKTGPLLLADREIWRARATVRDLGLTAPAAAVAVRGNSIELDLSGGSGPARGAIDVDRLTLTDLDPTHRFRPVDARGRAELAGASLQGRLSVDRAGAPGGLAEVRFTHDLAHGSGRAQVAAPRIEFAPGRLQPADFLPALGRSFTRVQGPVSATAEAGWGPAGLTSSAHITLDGVSVRTVLGPFSGVRGTLSLTSLAPLTSAPGQHFTAARLDTLLPLTGVSGVFSLRPGIMDIAGATATLAKGRATLGPINVPFDPAATLKGVVTLSGIDFAEIDSVLNLSNAVDIQSRMDGRIPFAFGPEGLRISGGRLAAVGPGRLSIRREALTGGPKLAQIGPAKTNAVQDFAYQALENLAFDALSAEIDSKPRGRLGVLFHIRGRHDPPKVAPTRVGLIDLLKGRAFDKPIPLPKGTPVDLTLDTSLNLDELLASYRTLDTPSGSAQVQP